MTQVTLYSRPECHLCDEARAMLERLGVPFRECDIDTDDSLFRRYLERIPVIVIDGEEAFELLIDEQALATRLGTLDRS